MSKKQNAIFLSTVGAEYIAAISYCSWLLWMKKLLENYGICQDTMTIFFDNSSTVSIFKSLVQHSRTMHISIDHHFVGDLVESKVVSLGQIP